MGIELGPRDGDQFDDGNLGAGSRGPHSDMEQNMQFLFGAQIEQMLAGLNIDLNTLEGKLRLGLIENRTQELMERALQPETMQGMQALFEGMVGNIERTLKADDPDGFASGNDQDDGVGEMPCDSIGGAEGTSFDSSTNHESSMPDFGEFMSGVEIQQILRAQAELLARQAAIREYMTQSESKTYLDSCRQRLADEGMAMEATQDFVDAAFSKAERLFDFHQQVFDQLLEVARTKGLEAALNPQARKQIIRGMMSREEYEQMLYAALDRVGDTLHALEESGRVDGSEAGRVVEALCALTTHNGQLERIESQSMREIRLDADAIYND